MKMTIQCDFDGTIIMNNLSILLREQFADSKWRETEADYLAGRLTVEESNRRQFLLIKEAKAVLRSFVLQNIRIRPGFLDFVEHCQSSGIRLVIVSSGLDFYIEPVIKSIGVYNVEVYCARTLFEHDGITVQYIDPEGHSVADSFKQRCLKWLRNQGGLIIYIGDGLSDLDVAKAADYVFATDHLRRLFKEESRPHHPFSSFTEITNCINRVWLTKDNNHSKFEP